jgi:hypothetical protein
VCTILHIKPERYLLRAVVRLGVSVHSNRYHARQAALALLKMAKSASDAKLAANLIDLAANLKEQAGELPPKPSGNDRNSTTLWLRWPPTWAI